MIINYDENLMLEYVRLYTNCVITNMDVVGWTAETIRKYKIRYNEVSDITTVPWFIIGIIHSLETGIRFDRHLHNGDPLNEKTTHVPKNRPDGDPPFTWVESAIDALNLLDMDKWTDWSIEGICYKLESYNGFGYRNRKINTPYLWSMTNQYNRGKYVSDGHFDSNAVSNQAGAMAIIKYLTDKKIITI